MEKLQKQMKKAPTKRKRKIFPRCKINTEMTNPVYTVFGDVLSVKLKH